MALLDNYQEFSKFGDFKDLYKEMLEASRKEPKDKLDLLRCSRLESLVDKAFKGYTALDKLEAVKVLVEANLVPQEWLDLQLAFNGEFKTITTTKGNNDFRTFSK